MPRADFTCPNCGSKKDDELVRRSSEKGKYLDWDTKKPITCDKCGTEMDKDLNLDFPHTKSGEIHKTSERSGGSTVMKRRKRDNPEEVALKRKQDRTGNIRGES